MANQILVQKQRSGKYCVAWGCSGTHQNNVSLHSFPKDEGLKRKWTSFVKIRRKDFVKPTVTSVLCERHFSAECYPREYAYKKLMGIPVGLKRLLPHAVPTVHVDLNSPASKHPCIGEHTCTQTCMSPPKKARSAYRNRQCAMVSSPVHRKKLN